MKKMLSWLGTQGFVDIDAEVTKFQKKLANTNKALEALEKKSSIPDYKNKVPVEIREANETKVRVDGCVLDLRFWYVKLLTHHSSSVTGQELPS